MTMFRTLAAVAAGTAVLATASADAAIVDVSTTADTVTVGETFEVRIAFSAETMEEFLFDASFDLAYDEELFSFVGADFADGTTDQNQLALNGVDGFFDAFVDTPGDLSVTAASGNTFETLQDEQADDFTIVTLTFEALMEGTGDLGFGAITDFQFSNDTDFQNAPFLNADILDGSVMVTVAPIPLPGAAVFLLTGAAGLVARRRFG